MLCYAQEITAFAATLVVFFLFHYHRRRRCCKDPFFTDLPVLGMILPILSNLWQIHDYVTQVLQSHGGTGNFLGPWFTQTSYVVTCDPMNVHHVMSKNFVNYVKGSEFHEIFEALGDGIFTADSDTWKYHRALLHSLFKTKSFKNFLENTVQKKVVTCLFPLLDHVEKQGMEVDFQDVFSRFSFDIVCSTILGSDPKTLAIHFPKVAICERAFNEVGDSIFYRHTVPRSIWKLQRWLQIGTEKKMAEACKVFDKFLQENIASMKEEKLSKKNERKKEEEEEDCLLKALMMNNEDDEKFLRDTAFNLFAAGRDTITSALTWFFWLVATHPSVEAKIIEEIKEEKETKNQVYLQGALCEALRLYPPIPLDRKQAMKHDELPSGHGVSSNGMILLSLYAMGRNEVIWGKDCLEFKPERWISERGEIIHVPSYKFFSFNAGPRACLGKDLSFIQMKIMAASILRNYHVHVVQHHPISPTFSIALRMKHGLKVLITKRG